MGLEQRTSLFFAPVVEPYLLVLGMSVLLLALVWSWRASAPLPPRRRLAANVLRSLFLVGLAVTLWGPSLRHESISRQPGRALVLVDRSESMAAQGRQEQVAKSLSDKALDRLEQRFELVLGTFDASHRPADRAALVAPPRGSSTDLSAALAWLSTHTSGSPLAGMVLVSDGVDRHSATLDPVARARLKEWGVPIFVLAPEPPAGRDVALEPAEDIRLAFVRNTTDLALRVSARGFAGETLKVELKAPGMTTVITPVTVVGDSFSQVIKVAFKPPRVGRTVVTVAIDEQPGETVIVNNRLALPIDVVRDRLRVLQVAGAATWDVRFLRRLLKEDPGIDLVSFFILRTPEDDNSVPESELALIPFPERELFAEQLHTFDVVLFQDFNYAPYSVAQYLHHVRDFVLEHGGGFAMIGGERSFHEGGYASTPLAQILPVELPALAADSSPFEPLVVTGEHPILALDPAVDTQTVIARLPLLVGANHLGRAKPGATVLLTHPDHREEAPFNLAVAAPMGRGRSLALAVDSLWRWQLPAAGKGGDGRPYYRFWHNALRWLSGDPALSRLRFVDLPESLEAGRPLAARLSVRGVGWKPAAGATVRLVMRGPDGATVTETGVSNDSGEVVIEAADLASGEWQLFASAEASEQPLGRAEAIVSVGAPSVERRSVGPDLKLLKAIAENSGGVLKVGGVVDLNTLPWRDASTERVEASSQQPLWNRLWFLLLWLIPGLLSIALRRGGSLP
jgi:uncharacterized membrane protein